MHGNSKGVRKKLICYSERERRIFYAGCERRTSMAVTYQLDKILHCVQDNKGLIYQILILPNTYDGNSNGLKSVVTILAVATPLNF